MKIMERHCKSFQKIFFLILLLSFVFTNISANAEDPAKFPSRPITFIIQWPPGGSTDVTGRKISELAAQILGQPIVIENKSGGGGVIGASLLAKAAPDGYTIGNVSAGSLVVAPHFRKVTFDVKKDFTFIMQYSSFPMVFAVMPDAPWKTLKDFIEDARRNPGKLSIANTGPRAGAHFCVAGVTQTENVNIKHVPTQGGAEVVVQLLGRHVDAGICTEFTQLVESKKVKGLGVVMEKRVSFMPDVPTFTEVGYGVECPESWLGIFAPAGLHPMVLKKISDAFRKAFDDPAFHEILRSFLMVPEYKNLEAFTKLVHEDYENRGKMIKKLGWK